MAEITELLDVNAIQVGTPAGDWREAVRAVGKLLNENGIAGDSYTEAMIGVVEEHGPYIVLAPGFALAHALPDSSVHRTGLSFVRLARPVAFGHASNDPVSIVMGLAATDDTAHQTALARLAGVLADKTRRAALDTAADPEAVLAVFEGGTTRGQPSSRAAAAPAAAAGGTAEETVPSKNLLLTVCGNGLGTSLFLKNTAEQVLDRWGWTQYLSVEATDTISAKGKAKDADAVLTSGAIADALGDIGIPVEVIENFTSTTEIDAALRRLYAV